MTYHFTLAVTKYSHTETSRKFSAFLSQIRDAFSIDGVTDENIKFPLLRSRLDDKTREMIPTTKPDETFEQYLIRLAVIFDDTLITNDLETQYSFFKLNFSSDKFEETLREFVKLHETIYRDLPAELNFQSFRRRLLDLLTPKPNLFKVILNSTATTNPTLVTTLVHFFKANGLLHKHSLDTCISTMDNYIPASLYTKQEHISSPNTFTVKNEVNNTSTTTVQSSPIIIRQTTTNNVSSKTIVDPDSNAIYIDPKVKNQIILSNVLESINQISSNGHPHSTIPAQHPTIKSLDGHSYASNTGFDNPTKALDPENTLRDDSLQKYLPITHHNDYKMVNGKIETPKQTFFSETDSKTTYGYKSSNQLADSISLFFPSKTFLQKKRVRFKTTQSLHYKIDQLDSSEAFVFKIPTSQQLLFDAAKNNTPREGVYLKRRGNDVVTSKNQIILNSLEETSKENKHIIPFTDIVTKYRIAAPLPDTTSSTIMNVITSTIQTLGPMKSLHTDNTAYLKKNPQENSNQNSLIPVNYHLFLLIRKSTRNLKVKDEGVRYIHKYLLTRTNQDLFYCIILSCFII